MLARARSFTWHSKIRMEVMSIQAKELYHQDGGACNQYKYGDLPFQKETIFYTQALYQIGKSIFQFKISPIDGDQLKVS